ncbi:MAG: hypothetical protein M3P30_10135 [Chloroflexota bacterium]|nr:hypothetical protein [Chloroflexota bacterium]
MNGLRKWWVAVAGGVVLAAVVGAGVVMAQTPAPGVTGSGVTLIDRVAAKLGIDTTALRSAVKSSESDQIDADVQAGKLTQAQADQMKQRIANAPDGALTFGGGGGPGGRERLPGGGANPDDLAQFLGVTADQVRTELQSDGATLATVAQAHGKSRDELKAFLTEDAQSHLDQAVTDGQLTQAQADTKLADLVKDLDTRIDRAMPAFGGPGHDGGFGGAFPGPGEAPAPAPTAAQPSATSAG